MSHYPSFIRTYIGIRRNMRLEKWELISDVLMSFLVFALVIDTGQNTAVGIVTIGAINTINFSDVFAAWRQYRREQENQSEQTKFQ